MTGMSIRSSTKRVRLAASPLMVAVALGLLGPSVLEEEDAAPSSIGRTPDDVELGAMVDALTQDIRRETLGE